MNLDTLIATGKNKKIFRDGDKCIKLFDENFSKANVLNEALNTARVEETSLNIPKILEVTKLDNKWAIISEYIEGVTLSEIMKNQPEKEDEFLNQFLDIQIDIQSQKAPLLNKLKDKLHRKISISGIDATTRFELHVRLEGMPKHNKVCHGDFNPSNIIIKEDGTPYILDWSHATQGNASSDAAMTYVNFYLDGNQDLAKKYLSMYCKRTDTALQYVQNWIPLVSVARLLRGVSDEEKQMLLQWTDVVAFE